jgi:hypothetical protein
MTGGDAGFRPIEKTDTGYPEFAVLKIASADKNTPGDNDAFFRSIRCCARLVRLNSG